MQVRTVPSRGADAILGRDAELAVLEDVLRSGMDCGSALLVLGEPGIGKSVLLTAVQATARDIGYTVLRATGVESEMHLPFGGVHQALGSLLAQLHLLPRAQQDALSTALGLADGPAPDLFLTAEAATALVARVRGLQPVLIIVDDVHWLDPQSHQVFSFIAHRCPESGVVVVGAARPGHNGPFFDAGFATMELPGVDDGTAEELLSVWGTGLSASVRRRIRAEAQGNPLALVELPRSWGDGPPSDEHPVPVSARVERAFAGRIAELPDATRAVLLLSAVCSSGDTAEIVAALNCFGCLSDPATSLGPAVEAGLIGDDKLRVVFRHPLVRSSVLQLESLTRRQAAHSAFAEVLTADIYRRAWHRAWSIVGPDDDVADELADTVAESLKRGAVMTAVSSLERAAQLTSSSHLRGRRLLQAADHAFGIGRADVVSRILGEAAQVDLQEVDTARHIWLSEALNGDVRADSAAVRKLARAADRARLLGDTTLSLDLLNSAALRCWWSDSGPDDRAAVLGVLDSMTGLCHEPKHIAAVALTEPVLRGSEVSGLLDAVNLEEVESGEVLRVYGIAAYCVGDLVLATDLFDRAAQTFRVEGRLGMLPVVLALQLHIRLDLGDWSGALAAGEEVVTVSRETGQAVFADNNILVEARGLALSGRWQASLDLMVNAEADALRTGVNDRICLAYQARGAALLSAGRADEAFVQLNRQYDPRDPGYHLRESFAGVALMAEAALESGRVDEARAVVEALRTVALLTPSPLLHLNLMYASLLLAPPAEQHARLREALAFDLTRWPWMRARVQLAHGRWLAANQQIPQARDALIDAAKGFACVGAPRWYRAAYALLDDIESHADLRCRAPRSRQEPQL